MLGKKLSDALESRDWLKQNDADEKRWADAERKGRLSEQDEARREADRARRKQMQPNWLLWSVPAEVDLDSMPIDERVRRGRPRIMGRYDNESENVFAIRRDIGYGRVIMITTGCYPTWNNLAAEHSVLLLDQALRSLLARSLPKRTFGPVNEIVIPVDSADQGASFTIQGPDEDDARPIGVEALSENTYGLILRSVGRRGLYRIRRERSQAAQEAGRKDDSWEMLLAVNGPAAESELSAMDEDGLRERMGRTELRWIGPEEDIRVEGVALIGHNYWKYLMVLALACLLVEMLFLAAPRLGGRTE